VFLGHIPVLQLLVLLEWWNLNGIITNLQTAHIGAIIDP
jgi:hypothetical protein